MSAIKIKLVVIAFLVLSSFSASNGNAGTYTWNCIYKHEKVTYAVKLVFSAQCPAAPIPPAHPVSSKTPVPIPRFADHEGCIIEVFPNRV